MNRLRINCLILAALLLLAACNSSDMPTLPVPDPTPTNTASPLASTIGYQYAGGIAGFQKEMTIAPGGFTTLLDRGKAVGTLRLPPDRTANLLRLFEEADFYNLEEHYENKDRIVADDTYTTLSLTQGDRAKEVTVAMVGGAEMAPRPLLDLISEVAKVRYEIEQSVTPTP